MDRIEWAIRIDGILDIDCALDDDVGEVIGAPGCNDGILLADDERLGSSIGGSRLVLLALDRSGFKASLWKVTDLRFPALSDRIRPKTGRILGIGGGSPFGTDSECQEIRRVRAAAGGTFVAFDVGRKMSESNVISFVLELLPVLPLLLLPILVLDDLTNKDRRLACFEIPKPFSCAFHKCTAILARRSFNRFIRRSEP